MSTDFKITRNFRRYAGRGPAPIIASENGLEAALKEVAAAAMTSVERGGVPTEQALHGTGKGRRTGAEQEMDVGGHQAPSVDREARDGGNFGEAIKKVGAIVVVKNGAAVEAASDDVMERLGGIEAWSARHLGIYTPSTLQSHIIPYHTA